MLATGPDGGPPYTVRWGDSGGQALFFPGTDAHFQHFQHTAIAADAGGAP